MASERFGAISTDKMNNFAAVTNPGVGDDSDDGYGVGSVWVNVSADTAFIAVDVTVGAAVWVKTGGSKSLIAKAGAYTITTSDEVVIADATAASFTLTLPTAVGNTGKIYWIKKIDATANTVTVDGDGGESIDGAVTAVLTTQYEAITVVSDGTEWWVL